MTNKLTLKKTFIIILSIFCAVLFAVFSTACAFGVDKYYNKPSKWHGWNGNLQIDFESLGSRHLYGVLTLDGKTAEIYIANSDYAQTFGMYKKVDKDTEPSDWLTTNNLNLICLGDYSADGDTVTFTILYDYTGFEGENALLGRKIVCQKYA